MSNSDDPPALGYRNQRLYFTWGWRVIDCLTHHLTTMLTTASSSGR